MQLFKTPILKKQTSACLKTTANSLGDFRNNLVLVTSTKEFKFMEVFVLILA